MPAMLAAVIGQAAGVGLDFAGGMMAANEGVSRRTLRRRGKVGLQAAESRDALFAGLERAELLKGQKAQRGGFQGARKALDLGANVARQGVIQRGRANQAATEQSVVSRGLTGTSTGAQAFAGVGDQTSQQLAAIDAQLAQAFADLGLEEGAMLGEQGMQRTALAGKNRGVQQQFSDAYFGLLTGS